MKALNTANKVASGMVTVRVTVAVTETVTVTGYSFWQRILKENEQLWRQPFPTLVTVTSIADEQLWRQPFPTLVTVTSIAEAMSCSGPRNGSMRGGFVRALLPDTVTFTVCLLTLCLFFLLVVY